MSKDEYITLMEDLDVDFENYEQAKSSFARTQTHYWDAERAHTEAVVTARVNAWSDPFVKSASNAREMDDRVKLFSIRETRATMDEFHRVRAHRERLDATLSQAREALRCTQLKVQLACATQGAEIARDTPTASLTPVS